MGSSETTSPTHSSSISTHIPPPQNRSPSQGNPISSLSPLAPKLAVASFQSRRRLLRAPYKNRIYEDGGFFARYLLSSGFGGSSASATSTPTSPTKVDLREQVHNLIQSLQNQGQELQQQRDEVITLKNIIAKRDARVEQSLLLPATPRGSSAVGGPLSATPAPLPLLIHHHSSLIILLYRRQQ
ncbi:hypothetical protein PIB30_038105 [Stylosanthes scabra]|uniref:Uncharacterized protein n=1 Tax=Stylosanthes scabra TaxID=79078 RepID=A0ABU6REH1_9FABA|nr:hypothetical protein [Stylosanthes scabra]